MNARDAVTREKVMATKREPKKWIQSARDRMKAKGTEGKFGKATPKKIAAAKKKGGVEEKRAVFAANMKRIAEERKHRGTAMKSGASGRTGRYTHGKKMKRKSNRGK